MNRCPVSQAEIDNDRPYRKVVNRNYDDAQEVIDSAALMAAQEFKKQMLEFGCAFHKKNMYTIVDAIEMIKDESLWNKKLKSGKTIDQRYHEDRGIIGDFYLLGFFDEFKTKIENEVNSLAQIVFKL